VFWTTLAQPFNTPLDTGDILARLLGAVWRPSHRPQPGAVIDMPDAFSFCCAPHGTLEICIDANCDVIKGVFKFLFLCARGWFPFHFINPAMLVLQGAFLLTNKCALPPPPPRIHQRLIYGGFSLLIVIIFAVCTVGAFETCDAAPASFRSGA